MGISNGCNRPLAHLCLIFTCWQVRHLLTYRATSSFMPFHQKFCLKSLYILVDPG
ncbi:hypothetical protein Hanom_Chr14g01268661 [Helianthus anomalus]